MADLRTALVCIAKNEDAYIGEWIEYHLKLGFSKIFVYQNNWRYSGDKALYGDNAEWIEFDGEGMQLKAYNDFIDNRRSDFQFAAFFDCDEFLRLPARISLGDFLREFTDFHGIAVNWRLFGDSGKTFDGKDYSVTGRFTKCQAVLNRHVKTILNVGKCGSVAHFINPHCVDISLANNVIASAAKDRFVRGPWNDEPFDNGIWLNHYFCKTLDEYKAVKMPRGKADTPTAHPEYFRRLEEFDAHNFNEIEDCAVKNIMEEK